MLEPSFGADELSRAALLSMRRKKRTTSELAQVHDGATCDASGMSPIVETRFHLIGEDYIDLYDL